MRCRYEQNSKVVYYKKRKKLQHDLQLLELDKEEDKNDDKDDDKDINSKIPFYIHRGEIRKTNGRAITLLAILLMVIVAVGVALSIVILRS